MEHHGQRMVTESVCQHAPVPVSNPAHVPWSRRVKWWLAGALAAGLLAGCEPAGMVAWQLDGIDDGRLTLAPLRSEDSLDLLVTGASSGRKNAEGKWVEDILQAIDARSGKLLWRFKASGSLIGPARFAEGKVYIGSQTGYVHCLSADTGKELWRSYLLFPVTTPVTVAYGRVYVGTEDGSIKALSAKSGEDQWQYKARRSAEGPIAAAYGNVFGTWDQTLYAVEGRTGKLAWRFATGGLLGRSGPVAGYGKVYIASWNKWVFAVNSQDGTLAWQTSIKGMPDASSPSLADGVLYIGTTENRLHAIDARKGVTKWTFTAKDAIHGTPAVTGNRVYTTSRDGRLIALDRKNGKPVWAFPTRYQISSSPAVAYHLVFFSGHERKLYGLYDHEMGPILWPHDSGDPSGRRQEKETTDFAKVVSQISVPWWESIKSEMGL
jgi:outer membrane protein assembly factor BamB